MVDADLGSQAVLVDTSTGAGYRLNSAGAWLWDRLREPASLSRLAEDLSERFAIEAGRATADTEAFAAAMVQRGLVEPVGLVRTEPPAHHVEYGRCVGHVAGREALREGRTDPAQQLSVPLGRLCPVQPDGCAQLRHSWRRARLRARNRA